MAQAKEVSKKLVAVKSKSKTVYLSLSEYYLADQQYEQAEALMAEAAGKYGASVEILIKYSDVLLRMERIEEMAKALKGISQQNAEGRPTFIANLFYKLECFQLTKGIM